MTMLNQERFIEEIDRYDWNNRQYHATKLIASSPFGLRPDNTPSFYVNLDPASDMFGCWADKGATITDWQSGGPVKLYAFLRNITYNEARDELMNDGDPYEIAPDHLRIKLSQHEAASYSAIDTSNYDVDEVPYLAGRGINEETQRLFQCGYDGAKNAAVMPWHAIDGTVINVKWRATWSKAFWYAKAGAPVRNMIYGIHLIYERKLKRVLIVESEIDAMYAWSCGVEAIATGGSAFTEAKAELLRRSPIQEIVIGTDNDAAGEKLRKEIAEKMRGHCTIYDVWWNNAKDANEVESSELRRKCSEAKRRNIFAITQLKIAN